MLFNELAGQFGRKLTEMFAKAKPEFVQREWAKGLADFLPQEIERGLVACHSRQFVPCLGEFALLCRPSLDGEVAWHEAQDGLAARRQGVWAPGRIQPSGGPLA